MRKMKMVGLLISGDKESLFNMMECVANGHEIICLANLYIDHNACEDIIEYYYEQIGSDITPKIAEAMEVPIIRRQVSTLTPLKGNGEDLYELLREVKDKHPYVQALSNPIFASEEELNCIEEVCKRLNLENLNFISPRVNKE